MEKNRTSSFRSFITSLRKAYTLLRRNDPLILASSTAFFATFSLSPIIVILVSVFSLYFKSEQIRKQLFEKLQTTVGPYATEEIEKIVHNFMAVTESAWITIGGFIFLLFVATTLLGIIRKAIHQLWYIRRKSSVRIQYGIKERMIGIGMLLFLGLLFLVALLLDASVAVIREHFPDVNTAWIRFMNILFSLLVVTAWFTGVFKILPEARVKWKVALAGGLLTAVLFSIGKIILGKLLVESNLQTLFGASASIALLLLFIFYSALMMYYGAAFTHVYAEAIHQPIQASRYADEYEKRVVQHS
ncbi:YihY/virulence factor BrkB family protein [Fulvivirgaceae bacterium PWU5]|uniref:YihY/virulence factor BrkB family protein n=1 Tax=Dawidia cretensis TaxID=2782350 RepID=A0AAP2DZT0_9BACT|nr:YihY/virulence factor BrkB family protein [Dawidia cretensis]MBT1709042.1 YihY/virulence factor BrkB family protein [Dawidia cretensis]